MKTQALMIGCIAAVMVLAGCARTQAIKDLEQDKVIIVETGDLPSLPEEIERLAQYGCSLHGRTAIPITTTKTTAYMGQIGDVPIYETNQEHLYACIEPENAD